MTTPRRWGGGRISTGDQPGSTSCIAAGGHDIHPPHFLGERRPRSYRWQAVQCEELRLTRVRGVPLADETQNVNNSALWYLDLAAAIHGVSEL